MPPIVHLVLLVLAFVCFLLAAWQPAAPQWNRLIAGGLATLTASMIAW